MVEQKLQVPFFNPHNPSLSIMGQEQLAFYATLFEGLKRDNHLDIQGNLGYLYVYVGQIFNPMDDPDYENFISRVIKIQNSYNEYKKINDYCNWLISDYYISKKQFKKALFYYPRKPDPHSFILLKNAGESYTINDAIDEYKYIFGHQNTLTNFGKSNLDKIYEEIALMYREVEKLKKINVIDKCTKFTANYEYSPFRLYDSRFRAKTITIGYYKFDERKFGSYIESNCYRVAENRVRQKLGLPLIGQGWLGETKLYYEIKKLFSRFRVTQHEKLPFLRQQHLDVFVHGLNIGIEYQGDQHSQSVDYFGGNATFIQTQERDERKRNLCEQNGVSLIYVYPDYDIEDVIIAIKEICAIRGIDLPIGKLSETVLIDIQNEIDKQYFKNSSQSQLIKYVRPKSQKEDKFTKWINDKAGRVHEYTEKEVSNLENRYLKKLDESKGPINKHYWLSELSYLHYRHREHPGAIEKCVDYCLQDIELFKDCMTEINQKDFDILSSEFRDELIHNPNPASFLVDSFGWVTKRILKIYEKLGKYDMAIDLCEKFIEMGIKDTMTIRGFEGRITYLQRVEANSKKNKSDD